MGDKSLNDVELTDLSVLIRKINDPEKASQEVCQYVDWLISTNNPHPPGNATWRKPSFHPCQRRHKDVRDSDSDCIELLNTVQRH